MGQIKVLQCFRQYLNNTENWAYRILSSMPDVENIIISKRFLKNNFYSGYFKYLEAPLKEIEPAGPSRKIQLSNKIIKKILGIYPIYVEKMLSGTQIDLLHSHFAITGWEYRNLAKRLNVPHVVSFYGLDYEQVPFTAPAWRKKYQTLFREVDLFICEGSFGAANLTQMGCPYEKVVVSRLGVNTDLIPFFNRSKKNGELNLLQIASLTEKKGHIFTLKAFLKALKGCPNMTLTLVGKDYGSGIKEQLNKLITEHNAQDKVTVMDFIDFKELHNFMNNYHVFIHPSCYAADRDCEGGAPIVLLDAQATGMPVISTNHCDIPEEVVHGKTGLLSSERDVEGLTSSIAAFYRMNETQYRSFCQNARKHVETYYDAEKNGKALSDTYRRVISTKLI